MHLLKKTYVAVQGLGAFDLDENFAKDNADYVIQQFLMTINKGITIMKKDIESGTSIKTLHSQGSILQVELTQKDWLELCGEVRRFINDKQAEKKKKKQEGEKPITYILMSYTEEE